MQDKERIDQLISYQEDWVKQLNQIIVELGKFRDNGVLISEERLKKIATAHKNIAGAIKNISEAIQSEINK